MATRRKHKPSKYLHIAKINFQNNLVYFIEFVMRAIFILVILFIFAHLWQVIYSSGRSVPGFTLAAIIWYLLIAECISTAQPPIHEEILQDIQTGNIAYALTKPYKYPLYYLAKASSDGIIRFLVTFILGSVLITLLVGTIPISLVSIPFIAAMAVLAFLIDFLFMFMIGLSAFWLEDNTAIQWIYQKFVFMVGGMLIPLEVYPLWFKDIAQWLPFGYIAYHPAKLFVSFNIPEALGVLCVQLGYIALLAAAAALLYRKAIKQVNINGG